MTIHLLVRDIQDRQIYAALDPGCAKCLDSCKSNSEVVKECGIVGTRRRGVQKTQLGTVYACTDGDDFIKSSKAFKKQLAFYASMIGEFLDIKHAIQEVARNETKRVIHNLSSLTAHALQELYALIPQDEIVRSENSKEQILKIQTVLQENSQIAAEALLRMIKNVYAMKTEFSVFNKLYVDRPVLDIRLHSIHKVITNVLSTFFSDFGANGININIARCHASIRFDYDSFSVALYHLFQNAAKYMRANTTMQITFSDTQESFKIRFQMESLEILPEEVERIFQEGVSGKRAQLLGKAGDGLGMNIVKRFVEMNGATIHVTPGRATSSMIANLSYANNVFEIVFPLRLVRLDSQ